MRNCGSQILKVRDRSSATFFSPQLRNQYGGLQYCGVADLNCRCPPLAFRSVPESPAQFYGDFCINLYSVDSNEHFIASIFKKRLMLIASLLQFLLHVKCFIAFTFKENHRFTLHRCYFFKKRFIALTFKVIFATSDIDYLPKYLAEGTG